MEWQRGCVAWMRQRGGKRGGMHRLLNWDRWDARRCGREHSWLCVVGRWEVLVGDLFLPPVAPVMGKKEETRMKRCLLEVREAIWRERCRAREGTGIWKYSGVRDVPRLISRFVHPRFLSWLLSSPPSHWVLDMRRRLCCTAVSSLHCFVRRHHYIIISVRQARSLIYSHL